MSACSQKRFSHPKETSHCIFIRREGFLELSMLPSLKVCMYRQPPSGRSALCWQTCPQAWDPRWSYVPPFYLSSRGFRYSLLYDRHCLEDRLRSLQCWCVVLLKYWLSYPPCARCFRYFARQHAAKGCVVFEFVNLPGLVRYQESINVESSQRLSDPSML